MNKATLLIIMLTSLFGVANAQFELVEKVEAEEGKVIIPYEKYKLTSNNLTLIIHEDHSDPIVHVQVAYHVGSARESVRNSGFAHFFEHMMFQGSKNVADEEHFRIISEAGGTNNAYTAFDKTVYINTAPSNLTETLLWLEADRMGTHLDGFTQEKFENQRDAVKNEKRQRYDNQPYGMVSEILFKSLYANHPYEWTPIGFVDDLDAASFDDLRNFFLRWYGPNNATVVVSGDVDPEEVKAWVAKYYGNINQCPEVRDMYPKKPVLATDYYVTTYDNIYLPLTSFAFPTVPEFHKDEAALDILAEILGGNNSSILYQNLVKTEEAIQASAGHSAMELSGFMSVQLVTAPVTRGGLDFKTAEERIRASLAEFETRGVADEDLQIVKNQVIRYAYNRMNGVQSKAETLSHFDLMKGNGYNLQDEIDRYSSVTKEDVVRVYNKYIKNKKAVIIRVEREEPKQGDDETSKSVNPHAHEAKKTEKQYEGLTYSPPVDEFERSARPLIPAGKAVEVPDFYTSKFDNGLNIIGSESTESPMVYFYLEIEGAHLLEANKKISNGTAMLTASMMGEGTVNYTTEEFSRELDKIGSSIRFNSGVSSTTVFISSLRENVDQTLALFQEAMFKPRFDPADFKRIKKQAIDGLRSLKSNPSVMSTRAFNQVMFEGTILADYYYGNSKSLYKIDLDDVKTFYNNYYSPNVTNLVVSGNISEDEALAKLDFLKEWKNTNVVIPALGEFPELAGPTIYLVDKPYAAQSTVVAAQHSRTYDYVGDFYKSTVMNYSLGGAFSSRINLNLREDKGYTYGARSFFSGNKRYGYYRFSSEIKKEATDSAVMELMKEINGFISGGITQEELDFTKSSITLSEALRYETPLQKLGFLNRILEYGLPADYTSQQATLINSMSIEDINSIARSSLDPNKMVIIIVGHSYKIKPGLEKLGYGKVKVITLD
ncbi:MAG: insulinase family protein [Bacteroidia bacterium]